MTLISKTAILDALRTVRDADTGEDVVSAGLISGLVIRDGKVGFVVTIAPEDKERKAVLAPQCEAAVRALPGVTAVTAILTAENAGPPTDAPQGPRVKAQWNLTPLPGVTRIIAVASGKGGVGKSTTAVNLARAFQASGQRVGLLDADIYGPSLPRMLGLSGQKPEIRDNQIIPLESDGIRCMSMGFIAGEDSAVVWRGPQLTKALQQMLRQVAWEPLDTLLIDLPPGTGDIHLSLVQQVPVNGAVIVTTPQDIATIDARKGIDMFRKVNVPVLGLIENMSHFTDPVSGNRSYIFGEGGGKRLAEETGVPFLGEVPLIPAIREAADKGAADAKIFSLYQPLIQKLL